MVDVGVGSTVNGKCLIGLCLEIHRAFPPQVSYPMRL